MTGGEPRSQPLVQRLAAETFRSLRGRNFRLFFAGQLVSQTGNWLTLVAQTLLVLRLTGSGLVLGLFAAAQFGPVLVLGAFAGLVADRSDKRKLLLVVHSLAMLQSFCLAGLAMMDRPPLPAIFAVAAFGGLTTAFEHPARRSLVVELVAEEDITNAVSLNSALMTGARVVGPALAGALVTSVGFVWCFAVDGLSYLAVLTAVWRMDPSAMRRPAVTPRARGQVREGLRYARSVPEIWTPMVMMAVVGSLAFNFQTVFPLFAIRDLGGSEATFTLLMSVVSIGSLTGALAAARRRSVGVTTVSWSSLGFAASLALLALAPNQAAALGVAVLVGLSSISFMTASTAIVQTAADPSMRGRVLALQAIVFLGSTPIGGPVAGAVAERFGARHSLGMGAAAAALAGIGGLVQVHRSARNRQEVDADLVAEEDATALVDPTVVPRTG